MDETKGSIWLNMGDGGLNANGVKIRPTTVNHNMKSRGFVMRQDGYANINPSASQINLVDDG